MSKMKRSNLDRQPSSTANDEVRKEKQKLSEQREEPPAKPLHSARSTASSSSLHGNNPNRASAPNAPCSTTEADRSNNKHFHLSSQDGSACASREAESIASPKELKPTVEKTPEENGKKKKETPAPAGNPLTPSLPLSTTDTNRAVEKTATNDTKKKREIDFSAKFVKKKSKKPSENSAPAPKASEEQSSTSKKAEEEAAARKKAEEEAARKKAEEEAAARKKAEEEAAARKKAEEAVGNGGVKAVLEGGCSVNEGSGSKAVAPAVSKRREVDFSARFVDKTPKCGSSTVRHSGKGSAVDNGPVDKVPARDWSLAGPFAAVLAIFVVLGVLMR